MDGAERSSWEGVGGEGLGKSGVEEGAAARDMPLKTISKITSESYGGV